MKSLFFSSVIKKSSNKDVKKKNVDSHKNDNIEVDCVKFNVEFVQLRIYIMFVKSKNMFFGVTLVCLLLIENCLVPKRDFQQHNQ